MLVKGVPAGTVLDLFLSSIFNQLLYFNELKVIPPTRWNRSEWLARYITTLRENWIIHMYTTHAYRIREHTTNAYHVLLIHWDRGTHMRVHNLTINGSDNGLAPTNAGILLIGPLGTHFSEILIKIHTFSFKIIWKYRLENIGILSRPQCVKVLYDSFERKQVTLWADLFGRNIDVWIWYFS